MLLKNAVKVESVKAFNWDLVPGVEFNLGYQNRKSQTDTYRQGYVTVVDEKGTTRQEFDAKKFSEQFAQKTIKGWKGLTLRHLESWMLLEEDQDLDSEVEFCLENAVFLLENWKAFEDWVTITVHSIERFRDRKASEVA